MGSTYFGLVGRRERKTRLGGSTRTNLFCWFFSLYLCCSGVVGGGVHKGEMVLSVREVVFVGVGVL